MKKSLLLGVAAVALCAFPAYAFAQATDVVVVPVAPWLTNIFATLDTMVPVVVTGIIGWASRKYLGHYANAEKIAAVEQILDRAIRYAINAAILASPQSITIPAHDQTIAVAVQYVIDHAPAHLIAFMGGKGALAAKILARLNIVPPSA